ncbi:radical SAM protein [Prescottella agglutinans]|uniref:23S rRNA (Adenine-C8)-methyltransferase n=1 Tax=Prescottella agglutinans TaxID=1644129 RepID=A0ABT6MH11_9NOCA|nr:radical SAM protein [Prescottella agglutinans]MDH6283605.1 23S rRNA (adenine-C8)-methyltransferase [Prescottella agglutinans]
MSAAVLTSRSRWARIRDHLAEIGEPEFRFRQLISAWRGSTAETFADVHTLPVGLRRELSERFGEHLHPVTVVAVQHDDHVEKVLFASESGTRIETVVSHYREGWDSLCISSQAGCGLGCTFCATGAAGLVRNLTVDEIAAQVMHPHWTRTGLPRPASVAFMGMGEALANPALFDAVAFLTDADYAGLSPRRLTVSTVGFAPNLARLVDEHPQVTITLSVHSPFPDQRARIIPLEDRYPLAENLTILDRYAAASRRKIYLAYLLIAGVNDSAEHLDALAELVRERSRPELFHVSVIRYNDATGADPTYRAPASGRVDEFVQGLHAKGIRATRRRQLGTTIDAACGQLHARYLEPGAAGPAPTAHNPSHYTDRSLRAVEGEPSHVHDLRRQPQRPHLRMA